MAITLASFTFAVVRNPWDRLVSIYCYRVETGQQGLDEGAPPFTEWARRVLVERDPTLYDGPKMFAPQVEWIADEEDRYVCPECGNKLFRGAARCNKCKATVYLD